MKMNVHSYGVLNGLGWILVLTDGWVLHTNWLGTAGFLLLVWSTWKMYKETDMTKENLEAGLNGTTAADLAPTTETHKTFTIDKVPVGDITVMEDNRAYKFNPQTDMTGQESALICQLFVTAVMSSRSLTSYDYMGYIRKHSLERHFQEVL